VISPFSPSKIKFLEKNTVGDISEGRCIKKKLNGSLFLAFPLCTPVPLAAPVPQSTPHTTDRRALDNQ